MKHNFIVQITHQQNATWQGTVTWVDEDRTQSFRSALELIRLIDSAVCEKAEEHTDPERTGPFVRGD